MKSRNVLAFIPAMLLIAALFSCTNPASVTPLSEEERALVLSDTLTAVGTATEGSAESTNTVPSRASGTGVSISPITNGTKVTFDTYKSGSITISGTVTLEDTAGSSFSSKASLSIIYNGETHTLGWDILLDIDYINMVINATGTFTIDGTEYDISDYMQAI